MGIRDWFGRLQRPTPEPAGPPQPLSGAAPRRLPTLQQLGMSAALLSDERGDDACVGCGLCQLICPTDAIRVEGSAVSLSARHGRLRAWPLRFELDPGCCVACELCMQVCPTDAIRLFRSTSAPPTAPLALDELRAQAASVQRARRRSPLGPVPGDEPKAPLVRPSTGAPASPRPASPRPASDLARPRLSAPPMEAAHPTETATSEPTRLESWAHPIDAATDPDSEDIEALRFDVETMPVRPEAPDRSGETTSELKVVPPPRRS